MNEEEGGLGRPPLRSTAEAYGRSVPIMRG